MQPAGLWVRCRGCYASLEVRGLSTERGEEGFEVTAVACPLCGTEHKLRPPMFLNRGARYRAVPMGDR